MNVNYDTLCSRLDLMTEMNLLYGVLFILFLFEKGISFKCNN